MDKTGHTPAIEQGAAPLIAFSECHAGILTKMDALAEMPALAAAITRARELATETLDYFHNAVLEHHQDEERELFPAVYASATRGDERNHVKTMTDLLTAEHRIIEAAWAGLKPEFEKAAKGKPCDIPPEGVARLVQLYRSHAAYEEDKFLPMAHAILGRNNNHMEALAISIHLRHAPRVVGYL
jgi:hemerythrin-like domain-containing protein